MVTETDAAAMTTMMVDAAGVVVNGMGTDTEFTA
jgi:hypothetical protein